MIREGGRWEEEWEKLDARNPASYTLWPVPSPAAAYAETSEALTRQLSERGCPSS